ncbi:pyridoxal phosphate-dependent aminotransferase [Carboxydothermus pertinax]|uniref:Aminotransferase n=1 Tax=Carboxydothermus pertinax TaxID=870242 RepID=A0A1L8CSV2_9THEO|nr:histidinol-phosphate transaminase [Carboxydothermus pertinax]GAV22015.1 hypothetical protein cpu_05250 [Carboxydothermus pertinax]
MLEHGGNKQLFYEKYGVLPRYDFSANLNPLGPPRDALKLLRENLKELISTYPDYRYRELEKAAYGYFQKEEVVLGNGASSLLNYLLFYLKPSRGLIIGPTFNLYEKTLRNRGIPVEKLDCALEEKGYSNARAYLLQKGRKGDLLFICRPNNPDGSAWPVSELFKLIALCQEKGIKLLLDESFADFMEDEREIFWRNSGKLKDVFILISLTKIFAIPGLRLGALILPEKDYKDFKKFLPEWEINNLAAEIGPVLLAQRDYLLKTRTLVKKEREYLSQNLFRLGFQVLPSKANFLMAYLPESISSEQLLSELAKYRIAVRPLQNFGLKREAVRIAVKTRKENRVLINALKNILFKEVF